MVIVEDAFRVARIHSVRHMEACEEANLPWGEQAITEMVMSRAAKAVAVRPFSPRAESVSGADWIWWWVDSTSPYGTLIQAKRLELNQEKWHFDFTYPKGASTQRSSLMTTAADLDLTPLYALYLGTGKYRRWESCSTDHSSGRCLACVKRSISLMPALLADQMMVNDSTSTYKYSIALEDLCRPEVGGSLLVATMKEQLASELWRYLTTPQSGVRAISKKIINRVLEARLGQFSVSGATGAISADGRHDRFEPIFSTFPADTGHWNTPYFKHVLGPLQQVPPAYVLELEAGGSDADRLASNLPENVGGIVVVRLTD